MTLKEFRREGGKARAKALTKEERSSIARQGAVKMWENKRAKLAALETPKKET